MGELALSRIGMVGRASLAIALFLGVGTAAAGGASGTVDAAQNWYTGGRDQAGTYYSPLTTINASNAKELGFAWAYDLGAPHRGQEATPVVIDGVLYTS